MPFLNYVQNKGQWNNNILYRSEFRGGCLFMENTSFTFLFYPKEGLSKIHDHKDKNAENKTLQFHTVKMDFEGASVSHLTQAENIQPHYKNYFLGNDPKKWAGNVPVSLGVIYKNLYNNIDVRTFSSGNNVRYDIIVAPQANATAVKLKYSGQDKLFLRNGKLIIATQVGEIEQQEPYAYQVINGGIKKVDCRYVLLGNKVTFQIGIYNKSLPLIIDPTLVFATYTGATADNWGMSASYDAGGNAYTAGIIFNAGYPTTAGAFQTVYGGPGTGMSGVGFDMSLSKFSPSGSNLIFSTYLGGNNDESPQSITVDNNNCLIVLGRSFSSNFPTTAGSYDQTKSGGSDITLTKFNINGTGLIGSTFVGGSSNDGINYSEVETILGSVKYNYADDGRGAVKVDKNNNIYVASSTSSADFPVTPGCLQGSIGGAQDGCVFKMDPNLAALTFCTYLGGSQNDAAYNLAIDSQNRIYVTGGTESANFPTTPGVIHTSYMGSIDGFVTHISAGGNAILQSSFIGTASYDQSYFVQTDKSDNVYLYGQCSGNYPIFGSVYSNPNSGQFIHKLNPTLTTTFFSTEFGAGRGTPDIVPSAFLVDNCQNIYISGWGGTLFGYNRPTSSTNGLPVSSGAFKTNTDGNDFYFAVFTKNAASLSYATFFGGNVSCEHVDGGTSSFDKTGIVYQAICESCGGNQDMPATPGVWSSTNGSTNCNNAVVKFKMDMKQTVAQLNINPFVTKGCAPFAVNFLNNSVNAVQYKWDFGDGAFSTQVNPAHTYTNAGTFSVTLIATDSSTCNQTDTTHIVIIVNNAMAFTNMAPKNICKGDTAQLFINSPQSTSYSWLPVTDLSNPAIANPLAWPSLTTTYSVTVHDTACNSFNIGTVLVTVNSNDTKIVTDPNHLCIDDTVKLAANAVYANYQWSNGPTTPSITVFQPGLYILNTVSSQGCPGLDSIRITGATHVTLTPGSGVICDGQSITIGTVMGNYTYQWTPTINLSDPTIYNPVASPPSTRIYTVAVANGPCLSRTTYSVFVNPTPRLQVSSTNTFVIMGEDVGLFGDADTTCYWYPDQWLSCNLCDTAIANPEDNTIYYCSVMSAYGCVNTQSISVNIVPTFYVPNSFTPNGDGVNDTWRPVYTGYVQLSVSIFDRWGAELYHYTDLNGGWNGMYRGSECELGVYIYKITAMDYRDNTIQRVGTVTIIR